LPQALVKEHAGGVALDQLAHGFRKQGGPRLGFFVELVCHKCLILLASTKCLSRGYECAKEPSFLLQSSELHIYLQLSRNRHA
jgi:hypothetical protein